MLFMNGEAFDVIALKLNNKNNNNNYYYDNNNDNNYYYYTTIHFYISIYIN